MKNPQLRAIDIRLTNWMAEHGLFLLRVSLGIIFLWFGVLKFFPRVSSAEEIASRTIGMMTFGLVPKSVILPVLALWETVIGLGLLSGKFLRGTLLLLWLQMAGTLTPFFLFPAELFTVIPLVPTLEGQYIIKNLILISAALVIGATVRGGAVVADPEIAEMGREKIRAEKRVARK